MTNANIASPRTTQFVLCISFVVLAVTGGVAVASYWNSRGESWRTIVAAATFVTSMAAIHLAGFRLYRKQPVAWSPLYATAVRKGLLIQLMTSVLFSTILMSGIEKIILSTALAFWTGVAIIVCSRPEKPRRGDLQFIEWGSLLLMAITLVLIAYAPMLAR